jgi:hypothetical protein
MTISVAHYRQDGQKIKIDEERLVEITKYLGPPGHFVTNEMAAMAREILEFRKQRNSP